MANTLPINFNVPSESAIASYNWTDISEGAGYVYFYPAISQDDSDKEYFLTNSTQIFSSPQGASHSISFGENSTSSDFNFDISLNSPRTIKGEIIVNLAYYLTGNSQEGSSSYVNVSIKKVSDTTTTLGSTRTNTVSRGAGSTENGYFCSKFSVNEVDFKRGDKIRLTFSIYISASDGGHTTYIGADPSNTPFSTDEVSRSILNIPFKIDL